MWRFAPASCRVRTYPHTIHLNAAHLYPPIANIMNNEPAVHFRAGKKRKAYRQRASDESDAPQPDAESSVAAALRARQARRRTGVGFSSDPRVDEQISSSSSSAVVPHDGVAPVKSMPDRFTHQTGLVAYLDDRHMCAFPLPTGASPAQQR